MERFFIAVEVGYQGFDAAFDIEMRLFVLALIKQMERQAGDQISAFAD